MINVKSDHIRVEGYRGKWYVISDGYFTLHGSAAMHLFLLEHETYGDETSCLIVDENGILISDEVYNGFDDIIEQDWEEVKEV